MILTARSLLRFPTLDPDAGCPDHTFEEVVCTPMDCEFFEVPKKPDTGRHIVEAFLAEDEAVRKAQHALGRPKPTKSQQVPIKKKGKGK